MASNPTQKAEIDRIKEVIRLLNLALADCHNVLHEAEQAVLKSQQDNGPSPPPN
jgi:hypothetical protein